MNAAVFSASAFSLPISFSKTRSSYLSRKKVTLLFFSTLASIIFYFELLSVKLRFCEMGFVMFEKRFDF